MSSTFRFLPLVFALLFLGVPTASTSPQDEAAASEEGQDAATEVAEDEDTDPLSRVVRMSEPGEYHEHLEDHVGTWDLTVRIWQEVEGEPVESAATAEAQMILGGRFLETVYRGEILGTSFEALSIEGYDNQARQFVRSWWDNTGTGTFIFRGQCEEECRVRTLTADFSDSTTSQRLRNKGVTTFELDDEDSYTYESFIVMPDGSEFKNMEFVARRR